MNKWMVRFSAVVLVVVLAIGAVGVVAAQGPDGGPGRGSRFPHLHDQMIEAIETATGLTQEDVLAQLREGKTFNEVLAENSIDPQVVIDAVTAVITDELNAAVTDGRITQLRADDVLENLPDHLDRLMNATLPERPFMDRVHMGLEDSLLGVLAEMAGVDARDLLQDALTPPSLAEIATANGLDPDAIITETEKRITEDVNAAVADGRMTEAAAANVLDGLHDRLVERFNAPFHPMMQFGGPGGFGGRMGGRMGDRMGQPGGRMF